MDLHWYKYWVRTSQGTRHASIREVNKSVLYRKVISEHDFGAKCGVFIFAVKSGGTFSNR